MLRAAFWLIAAFVISFFAVGFPYWQIPYAKVSLPSTLYGTGLVVVGVLAAAARAIGKARLLTVILAVGAAVPAPILARITVDTVIPRKTQPRIICGRLSSSLQR